MRETTQYDKYTDKGGEEKNSSIPMLEFHSNTPGKFIDRVTVKKNYYHVTALFHSITTWLWKNSKKKADIIANIPVILNT